MKFGVKWAVSAVLAMILTGSASAQTSADQPSTAPVTTPTPAYQPKYHGDPAHSDSEFVALAYMRTVLRAQHTYKKKYDKFAPTLADLVHSGSFTKRMTQIQQGDYIVSFHTRKNGKDGKDGFELTMTPKQLDATHRSFYANEDGTIHADEQQSATETSPKA